MSFRPLYSPSAEHREHFAREMARDGMDVVAVAAPKAVVAGADIVCCATTAMTPVFNGDWLEDGQVVVSIANSDVTNKRSEVDRRTYERASAVIINDWESVIGNDQTELLEPLEKGVIRKEQICELGDLLIGKARLPRPVDGMPQGIVYYKNNSGMAIQFAAAGGILYRKAMAEGNNKIIPTEWLGSDLSAYYKAGFRLRRDGELKMGRCIVRFVVGCVAGLLPAVGLPLLMAAPASADDVADFYRGKRISLVVGYGTGGGYDLYARMLGRFMGEHIPGKPTIIAQNMPGAGSRGAANWLYKVAPRDGSVIATLSQTTPTDQALGQPGVQFDVRKFNWIGNTSVVNNLLFVSARSGVATLEQAKSKPLAIGATGASSPSVLYPQVSNNLLGTKFRIVSGYPSGGDINIAVERGEVDGRGSDSFASMKSTHPDWLRDRTINILFQIGAKREADLPDVPLWSELGQTDEQRQVLEILSGDVAVGRPILTAPDVPPDRVRALRRAFDETLADPAFVDAMSKANMEFHPIGGQELQDVVSRIAGASPQVIAMVKEAIKIKDVRQLPGDQKPKEGSPGEKE